MTSKRRRAFRNRLLATIVLVVAGLIATAFLGANVVQELRLLNSARSDNVQWTLSQAEVEFLELEHALLQSRQNSPPDLRGLRREFDIFYSRINTLTDASIYAPVREIPAFADNLIIVQRFLDETAAIMDSDDTTLEGSLEAVTLSADDIRADVRTLAKAGLNYFAEVSDTRRRNISKTLMQLAAGVTLCILTLLLLSVYLGRLNRINIRRSKEVANASKRMNTVIRTALDGVIVVNADGRIIEFNAAAEQIFGHRAQDAIGSDMSDLIVPDHHFTDDSRGMDRLRIDGERRVVGAGRLKLEAKRANGDIFPIEVAIQSANTPDGEIFIAFLRDISHRVAAERDLVEARDRALAGEKSKTDFLATMSHEIRTPLNGLLGNLTLLQDTTLNKQQRMYVKNMNTSGKLLMSHISDVLDITKYDAGKLQLSPVDMNISTLVQDIVDNQSGPAAARDTKLSWRWKGQPTDWISADSERIQHVLMNVVGNAVKFTHGGEIFISVSVMDVSGVAHVEFQVQDSGIGMSADLKSQIFDDFMTGDVSYDRTVGGTGLGLGIAQRFVAAMGGTIEVESTEGFGSVFTIAFPVVPIAAPVSAPVTDEVAEVSTVLHVLLVEDNEINRLVAREMLSKAGHTVTEAHNGQQAVDITTDTRFDLILMDISMPVMDGRAATRAIRGGSGPSSDTPIVALTANAVAEEQAAFLSDGMNDVMTKPLSREGLLSLVSRYATAPELGGGFVAENQHLADLYETLGPDAAQNVIARFVTEVEGAIAALAEVAEQPLDDTIRLSHRIAGSAGTMGADALREGFIAVENAAKRADVVTLRQAAQALPAIWKTAQREFAQPERA